MGKRLFVGNLSYGTDTDGLRAAFEAEGLTVADAHVMTDRETGRSRGFGFIEVGSEAEAGQACETMDGFMLDGRPLRVNEAHERPPRQGAGGGGGGGGRGGGYGGGGGRGGGYGGGGHGGGGHGGGGHGGGGHGGGGGRRGGSDRWDRDDQF